MTAIVGVAAAGEGVVLGADSIGADGWAWGEVATPKLYQPRSWLAFGFTTSWRFGQILGHQLAVPARRPAGDPLAWLVETFVPAAQKAMSAGGWQRKKDERAEAGTAVVAFGDRVWTLQDDYSVTEYANGIETAGVGWLAARVAACVARDVDPTFPASDLAALALRHAELHTMGVRGPFHFVSTK